MQQSMLKSLLSAIRVFKPMIDGKKIRHFSESKVMFFIRTKEKIPTLQILNPRRLKNFIGKKISHPPYSPDLASSDNLLFCSLQNHLNELSQKPRKCQN